MNKKIIIGAIVVIVAWLSYLTIRQPSGNIIERVVNTVQSPLGGVSNLDILNVGPTSLSQASSTQVTSGLDNNGLFENVVTGTCNDASSTLISIVNPFRATSTVDYTRVDVTEYSTTTVLLTVGTTSASVSGITDPPAQPNLINLLPITYGQKGSVFSGASTTASSLASSSVQALLLGPFDKLTIFASGTTSGATSFNYNGGVVGGNNNFACTYKVRFTR